MIESDPILTVAVPTYNMEVYLEQNLNSLLEVKSNAFQVLVLDNASTDASGRIADDFVHTYPQRFSVVHKENHGYGSSINLAIIQARGRYLRIVDADDWIEPPALDRLLHDLEDCTADLVICDYTTVEDRTGVQICVDARPLGVETGICYPTRNLCAPFPQMHATIFRTDFLRENRITLLEDTFYVDEQLMILSCLHACTFVYYDYNIYCYRLGRSGQSVSARTMGQRYSHRERELKSCLASYQNWVTANGPWEACLGQLARHVGNHFTTLFLYVAPPVKGRDLALKWRGFLAAQWPELDKRTDRKRRLLTLLNLLRLGGKNDRFLQWLWVARQSRKLYSKKK